MAGKRSEICPWRFAMTRELAGAFAARANIPSSNFRARAHAIVKLADALVSKLEELEGGLLTDEHIQDNYEDM